MFLNSRYQARNIQLVVGHLWLSGGSQRSNYLFVAYSRSFQTGGLFQRKAQIHVGKTFVYIGANVLRNI